MTLFTAEGIIRAGVRMTNKGICHAPGVVHHAYLRWLKTQGEMPERLGFDVGMDGWLVGVRDLWSPRAPGSTCISALRETARLGDPAKNDSKGCGTVMRTAPIGLSVNSERVFEMSAEVAALTHGHPTASCSAGFVAVVISEIVVGATLDDAIKAAKRSLSATPGHAETLNTILAAENLAATNRPDAATVERLGGGWIAEEAAAIALYCVIATACFEDAIVLAVNHSGDSDSTGAIAGNIAGVLYGADAIPARWLEALELKDEITTIADDLLGFRDGTLDLEDDRTWDRYPGW
jgi:ADP-ribosylglycohydrolase